MTDLRKHTTRIVIDPRKFLPLILLPKFNNPASLSDKGPERLEPIPESAVFLYAQINPNSGYLELVMSDPSFNEGILVGATTDLPSTRRVKIKGVDA